MSAPPVYGTNGKVSALLDGDVTRDIMTRLTDQQGKCVAEYVWIGGSGADLRSKGRCAPASFAAPAFGRLTCLLVASHLC